MHHVHRARHRAEHYLQHSDADQRETIRALHETLGYPTTARATRGVAPTVDLHPLTFDERSANELRPANFSQMVGQERLKRLMARIVQRSIASGRPLDHIMLAGQSGTGKTTLGQVVAHESGRRVFQVKAPVTHAVLRALATKASHGDVVIVDEIHQQVAGDRRGVTQAADPEDFYHIMEDRKLPLEGRMIDFPAVTFIGCTTDEGLLPEALLNRFPLRLTLDPYTSADMATLAVANARQLGVEISADAAAMFGLASRRNPRQTNTYVRNAVALGYGRIDAAVAREVIVELNHTTLDGLTADMQRMLRFLLSSPRMVRRETRYQASVNTIATALGHSRDTKAVSLYVEPYLIEAGYVAVGHGGRMLTPAGVKRARQL